MKNDLVLFTDGNIQLEVPVSQDGESVWLSANQMAVLFDKDETNIRKHINNVFKSTEVDKDNNTQKMRVDGVKQPVAFYSLDVILAVGYRVNSQRGIAFRKWANNVLKQFILKGYAINEKRLQALEKTVDIQTKMLAGVLDIEEQDVLRAVNEYTDALLLLDQYDHQALCKVCIYGSSSKEKESQNILEKTSTTFLCFCKNRGKNYELKPEKRGRIQ